MSSSTYAFQPLGNTHLIAAANPAPAPVQILVDEPTTGVGQYRIINNSINTVFLGVGANAAQATANAAAIVTNADTIVLVPGAVEILRFRNNAWFTAFAAAASNIYITPGQGL
jgi:hypothetical protein